LGKKLSYFGVFIIKQFLYEKGIKINGIRSCKIGKEGY